MSPYKTFLNNTRQYFNTNGFLRFLLSMYIGVFALGGVFYAIGSFVPASIFVSDFFGTLGIIFMLAGLQLTIIKEDEMTLVIGSASISFIGFLAWLLALAGAYGYSIFFFSPLFFFLAFGAIATVVFIKGEKFIQMRAAAAVRSTMAGIACPRCGGFIPMNAAFCPSCGTQNPNAPQYAAPMQPQYAPPAQPQYAPPVQPQYTAPAPPQYAPPVQPQDTPPAPPAEPEATPTVQCVNCSAFIPAGAAFCSKCGTKQ